MCIAILQKRGKTIDKDTLRTCYNNNPDGCGILWIENGKLKEFKELDNFELFYACYQSITKKHGKKSNIVLHFRISTHGKIDLINCHPHFINSKLAFVHNGMIDIATEKGLSDTIAFKKLLQNLPKNFIENKSIRKLIKGFSTSKFVFLRNDNKYFIIGEKQGEWENGIWFSNTSYQSTSFNFGHNRKSQFEPLKQSTMFDGDTYGDAQVHYNKDGEMMLVYDDDYMCPQCFANGDKLKYTDTYSKNDIEIIECTKCGFQDEIDFF